VKTSTSQEQTGLFTSEDDHKEKMQTLQQRMTVSIPDRKLCLTVSQIMLFSNEKTFVGK